MVPAVETRRKRTRASRRACHVCKEVIPTNVEGYKLVKGIGKTAGDQVQFWMCRHHGELFLTVLNWEESGG